MGVWPVLQYKCRRTLPCTERRKTTNPLAAAVKLIASPPVDHVHEKYSKSYKTVLNKKGRMWSKDSASCRSVKSLPGFLPLYVINMHERTDASKSPSWNEEMILTVLFCKSGIVDFLKYSSWKLQRGSFCGLVCHFEKTISGNNPVLVITGPIIKNCGLGRIESENLINSFVFSVWNLV